MDQQVQDGLFQLAPIAKNHQRHPWQFVFHLQAFGRPFTLPELEQTRQQHDQVQRLGLALVRIGEGNQPAHNFRAAVSFKRNLPQFVFRRWKTALQQQLIRHPVDSTQRQFQLVCHAGYQLSGRCHLLAPQQLFAHALLLLQLERSGNLVCQMLYRALLVGAQPPPPPVKSDCQHPKHLALGKHRDQQCGFRQFLVGLRLQKRALVYLRQMQLRPVSETERNHRCERAKRTLRWY